MTDILTQVGMLLIVLLRFDLYFNFCSTSSRALKVAYLARCIVVTVLYGHGISLKPATFFPFEQLEASPS